MKLIGIKISLINILLIFTVACSGPNKEENAQNSPATDTTSAATETQADTTYIPDSEYATYYLVIADTGRVYSNLQQKMYAIQRAIGQKVDTMDRYYNAEKDLICLPDSSDDAVYAGEYYPRRDLSNTLSVEYLDFYNNGEGGKTMVLLTGIYETEASADSALAILKKAEPGSFKMKSEVFQGCMH